MRIYIAAPIFKPEQLAVVEEIMRAVVDNGHDPFSPYHNSRSIWRGRAPQDCSPEDRALVLADNISYIDWCDVLLCWVGGMGGYTDPGVIWEMGYAYKADKFLLAYLDENDTRQNMNLMLAGTIAAIAKGHSNLIDALQVLSVYKKHSAAFIEVVEMYNPDDVLLHENEPIS